MDSLRDSIISFTNKVRGLIYRNTPYVIKEVHTLTSDTTVLIDLPTQLGGEWRYDYPATEIIVKIRDTSLDSPTVGCWIDGSGVVLTGCDDLGVVRVHNLYETTLEVTVYVKVVRVEEV